MAVFWDDVLSPLLEALGPERIVEIGAEHGTTTRLLLQFAEDHGGTVHSIDPRPLFDLDGLRREHPDTLAFHVDLSLNVLPELEPVDFALIDGDHNWYTVLNELKLLEQRAREEGARVPMIALHDIDWPYGRRDLYYDPEAIPADKRRAFEYRGLRPDIDRLVAGGLNSDFANATEAAASHSGVRGAIEDFISESEANWRLFEVPGEHGLGILASAELLEDDEAVRKLLESTRRARFLRSRVEAVERARIDTEIRRVEEDASRLEAIRALEDDRDRIRVDLARAREEFDRASKALLSMQEGAEAARNQIRRLENQREALEKRELAQRDARAAGERELVRLAARLEAETREHERLRAELERAARDRRTAALETGHQLQSIRGEVAALTEVVEALRRLEERRADGAIRRGLRRINRARRSASQMASWVFRRPSRERLRYVSTYFALKRSGAFDADFYEAQSPDVAAAGLNPLMHYVEHGAKEGRDPNSEFKTSEHLERHPRLLESGLNPLLHVLRYVGPEGPSDADTGPAEPPTVPAKRSRGEAKARRRFIAEAVAEGATVLIAGGEDPGEVEPEGMTAWSFPRSANGEGRDPAGSTAAMAQLESLRADGADYLVLPEDATQWLSRYPAFGSYLDRHYRTATSGDEGIVFDLRREANRSWPWPGRFEELVHQHQARFGAQPDVLDWETNLQLAARFTELTVIEPLVESNRLPYLGDSIDLVVTGAAQEESHRDEARRVAQNGIVSAREIRGSLDFTVDWLRDAARRLPAVSIVIPSFDAADLLESCLAAVAETVPRHLEAEFIIVDDASSDGTRGVISRWSEQDDRVRSLRNEENQGFVVSCNRGAAAASGDVLVFLNNDTIPLHGWLDPLIRTLLDRADAGSVGGMLVYPNGTLQEAGAIVFSDGSGANFGKADPQLDRPTYQFLREVDYCSGALLATRGELFAELGGFDTLFAPGYYEDTDYCFRARAAGLRTYYQPESVVVHLEGATGGTDVAPKGPKQHQAKNRLKFEQRWADVLRSQPTPPTRFDQSVWNRLARHRPPAASRS